MHALRREWDMSVLQRLALLSKKKRAMGYVWLTLGKPFVLFFTEFCQRTAK
jgi:hypothetical protein